MDAIDLAPVSNATSPTFLPQYSEDTSIADFNGGDSVNFDMDLDWKCSFHDRFKKVTVSKS